MMIELSEGLEAICTWTNGVVAPLVNEVVPWGEASLRLCVSTKALSTGHHITASLSPPWASSVSRKVERIQKIFIENQMWSCDRKVPAKGSGVTLCARWRREKRDMQYIIRCWIYNVLLGKTPFIFSQRVEPGPCTGWEKEMQLTAAVSSLEVNTQYISSYCRQRYTHSSTTHTSFTTFSTNYYICMPLYQRSPVAVDLMFRACPSLCPVVVNTTSQERQMGITSNLVPTFSRMQGWTDLNLVVELLY